MKSCKKVFVMALALASVFTASVFAGGGSQAKSSGQKRVGFINAFGTTPYSGPLNIAAEKRAKELGVELLFVAGKTDNQLMYDQALSFIDQKVDAILFLPADMAGSVTIVKAITNAKIPLVGVNNQVDPSVTNLLTTFVGADVRYEGEVIGKLVVQMVSDGGKCAILEGFAGQEATILRAEGFKTGIKGSKIQVVQEVICDWDRAKAMNAANDLITAHPDLKIIYAEDDSMAFGAIEAVKAAGKMNQIKVFGLGFMGDESRAALKSGELAGTCTQSPTYEGKTGLEKTVAAINGEKLESYYMTECIPVTKDNCDSIDHGYNQ
jgi:ABC-type sugar transport system substrate-binding protein